MVWLPFSLRQRGLSVARLLQLLAIFIARAREKYTRNCWRRKNAAILSFWGENVEMGGLHLLFVLVLYWDVNCGYAERGSFLPRALGSRLSLYHAN